MRLLLIHRRLGTCIELELRVVTKVISTGALEASVSRFDSCLLDKRTYSLIRRKSSMVRVAPCVGVDPGSSPGVSAKRMCGVVA